MSRAAPIHPGEILRDEFGCRGENCPDWAINIVSGREDITPKSAKRLAYHFLTSSEFWVNLQATYDKDMKNV